MVWYGAVFPIWEELFELLYLGVVTYTGIGAVFVLGIVVVYGGVLEHIVVVQSAGFGHGLGEGLQAGGGLFVGGSALHIGLKFGPIYIWALQGGLAAVVVVDLIYQKHVALADMAKFSVLFCTEVVQMGL